MRVLLTAFAMDSHFNGVVPLAWALRTAGHDVRVASQPDLTDSITRAGLTAVPVGENHQVEAVMSAAAAGVFALHQNSNYLENRPHLLKREFVDASNAMLTAVFYSQINNETMIDDTVDFARWWQPHLVIWEPFTFAGGVAAHATGAAHARLLWGPDLFLRVYDRFREVQKALPLEHQDDPFRDWLTWTLHRHDATFHPQVVTGQWTIDQMPESVRIDTGRSVVPMRYVPYNGPLPAVVPRWLRAEPTRPRVCLTQGVTERTTGFAGMDVVGDLLEHIAQLDVEVVVTMKETARHELRALPRNVRIVDSVPVHALLPTCSAVLHHGGAGTWSTAALYGVPQLSLAWQWDDVFRSKQMEKLGAGIALGDESDMGTERIRDVLTRLLDQPSYRDGAERMRKEMLAAPHPNDVVTKLEQLTTEHHQLAAR